MKRTQKASLALLLSLLLLSPVNAARTDKPAANSEPSLWQCVSTLAKSIPFTQKKVEAILNIPLAETDRNEYTIFLKGHNAWLSHKQKIGLIDLRLNANEPDAGFLVINIDGACTTLEDVRIHYPDVIITQTPRRHSLEEATSYTSEQPWGRLSFGFKERNRACLAYVVLAPKG